MADNQDITLKIRVLDAQGNFRGGTVDVEFKHRTLSDHGTQRGLNASGEINIAGLRRAPTGDYQITVIPTDVFKPQSQFVNIPASGFAEMKITIDRGLTPEPRPDPIFVVKGMVSTAAGAAFTKGLVRVTHQNGSAPLLLGEGRTDNQGNYLIKYLPAPVAGAINLLVQVFDEQGGVLAASDIISSAQPMQQVDLVIKGEPPVDEKVFIVRGTILDANSKLLAGATVRAFDRDLRSEEELGQTVTDTEGQYQIHYSASQFRRNEKGSADLRVAVFNQNGPELVSSEIHFNAEPETTIDLKAGADPAALSEYERYQSDLKLVLEGVTLIEIAAENPVDQDKDLDFLSRDTGIERQHIAWLVGAARLEQQTLLPPVSPPAGGVPAEVFYGWFRKGLPTDWEGLWLQPVSRLRTALIEAIDQNIIPSKLREDAEKILARVPNPQIAELATLLGRASLSADKIQTVLTVTDGIEGVTDEVLAHFVAQNTLAAREAQSIGLGVSLHRLTGGDQSLVSRMLDTEFVFLGTGKLRQARDLASLESEDWERALEAAHSPVPEGTTRTEYARSLAIDAVSEFPHAAFVQRAALVPNSMPGQLNAIQPLLEKNANAMVLDFDALDLTGIAEKDRARLREAHGDLKRFANFHPGLDLHSVFAKENRTGNAVKLANERVGWLRTVFDLNPAVNFLELDYLPDSSDLRNLNFGNLPEAARGPVLQDLKAHQRIYTVTNNAIASREIMQAGFHSASAIALTPVSEFAAKADLPLNEAQTHHAAARDAGNQAALIWFNLYGVARDQATTPIRSIPSPHEFFKPLAGFQDLINSQPWCECAHCQSVLSPAAYFVDLMYYIEEGILKDSFIGKENHPLHLRVRRPDLWTLELTCRNTNDYVPYLDVVNEVLETYLKDVLPELKALVPPAKAEDVYQHLSRHAGSFQQPFTLPLERLEILLGHFGLSRYDVAKAMGSDKQRQARTRLKISQQEYDLITTERTAIGDLAFFMQLFKLKDAISISSADTLFNPIELQALLGATGLPHDTFASVLNTKFVLFDAATIDPIQIVLGKRKPDDVQNNSELVHSLTLRRLDRIHRFVRLWRKLPWTIEELDYVLARLKTQGLANGIDGNALSRILDLLELNAQWSLPIDELMALCDVFPENGLREPTAFFDRLFNQQPFLDRDGRWPPNPAIRFTHPAWANSPQGVSSPDNNTLSRLLAGLQLGDKELLELIASLLAIPVLDHHPATLAPLSDESIGLSKDSLGLLYRHARLMRLLKCTMTDFIKLISLTPRIAARDSMNRCLLDLEDVASVIEFTASQRTSGFSLDEMIYVTSGTRPEGSPDPAVLASEIAARVQADKSLEFADTVFTQIGFTDVQSRKIVTDNVGPGKAFSRIANGASYRLNAGFILDSAPRSMQQGLEFADSVFTQIGLTDVQSRQIVLDNKGGAKAFEELADGISFRVNAGFILDPAPRLLDSVITLPPADRDKYNALAVDLLSKYGALAAELLRKYDAMCVLDVALGGALNLSPEQTQEVRQLTRPLRTDEVLDIYRALQGGDRTRLTALLTDTLRYRALFKSEVFLLRNKLSNDGLSFVGINRGVFGLPKDPAAPEYHKISTQAVWNVAAYVALAKATDAGFTTASGSADLDAIQRVTKDFGAASTTDLARTLRTDEARIAALKPHLNAFPPNPFAALGVLARCLLLMEQMGVSGETLSLMNDSDDTFISLSRAAEDVFGAFRAKYPNAETFNEKMEPFEDQLRTRKRDGLVDFIVSAWPETFAEPNKLYEYFLIDVLQGGCARTSRVVAAISSLQLYVYRVLMHLEWSSDFDGRSNGVNARFADSGKRAEWYWREHYRVWEANRKVFLYPENYIEPELRDDKTPLFKELEETLLQQEINDQNAHDAYAKYLTGFEEVAHLGIAGAYYDSPMFSEIREDALHLFGVTRDAPPVYYYRVINNTKGNARVSAWQKLTLQIPVRKVSPIVFEGRLYIFWMETTTKPLTNFVNGSSKFGGYRHSIRVKYSRQRPDGQWISPQVLGFVNGSATEECRVVDDPPTDNADRLAELKHQIDILTPESTRLHKKAADAEEPARVAENLALSTALELRAQTDTAQPNAAEWILIVGASAALAPVIGPELALAQSLVAWRALKLKPFVDAANAAAEDHRRKAEELATSQSAAIEAQRQLEELIIAADSKHLRVSVLWEKRGREHRDPVDNYTPEGWEWDRVYPNVYFSPNASVGNSIRLMLVPRNQPVPTIGRFQLLTSDEVDLTAGVLRQLPRTDRTTSHLAPRINNLQGQLKLLETHDSTYGGQLFYLASFWLNSLSATGTIKAFAPPTADVQIVNGSISVIIESGGQTVWMRREGTSLLGARLGTTLTPTLSHRFGHEGESGLLNAEFQQTLVELPPNISPVDGESDATTRNPFHPINPFLTYFRETFFHIPFLAANHLNSEQKFVEAQRWYQYIFNPTAANGNPWRYREFNDPALRQSLRETLTSPLALAAYRADPFSPHAIARTRLSAYQKSIVMKYIDNLLDWGDSLFSQFTMESLNEATMLYVMAQEILGPRPAELGSCGEGQTSPKNYQTIRPGLNAVSDFLIELEAPGASRRDRLGLAREITKLVAGERQKNSQTGFTLTGLQAVSVSTTNSFQPSGNRLTSVGPVGVSSANVETGNEFTQVGAQYWTSVGGTPLEDLHAKPSGSGNGGLPTLGTETGSTTIFGNKTGNIDFINSNRGFAGDELGVPGGTKIKPFDRIPPPDVKYGKGDIITSVLTGNKVPVMNQPQAVDFVPSKNAVFCIPPNQDLLAYWSRVEDRLFKIRNCMDIAGVRRQAELFAPEIDPRLLVRMKAAGLTLDDVLNSISGNVPPYRFSYLIEKAKQCASTLQSFGAQLLSAIEKHDGEELSNLRAVHEHNLLTMRTRMTRLEIDAAEDAIEGLRRQKTAVEYRLDYFRSLSDVGPIASERTQQKHQRQASEFRTLASVSQFGAAVLSIIPDAGAPTAMKFGGSQLGAAGRAAADGLNAIAGFNEMAALMAGIESSNQRRDQEWRHQAETAKRDISQIEKQIAAAEIRKEIAIQALAVHEQTIAHSEEMFEFFRNEKFTNINLYRLLSNRLQGLYRQAFNSALGMARMAEQAFSAERTDDETRLSGNYWDASSAGLLAGERLLIDLQSLELHYIEKNYRQLEVEQSFSLAQFAPDQLAKLRFTGECEFSIPEWFFDLFYPGQYRRRLKAVRLTLPCITGPYTNVGATLRLQSSSIRLKPLERFTTTPQPIPLPTSVPLRHSVSIAASKAQYDSGVFDLSFRDERYMPFEGAGAISKWQLSLPEPIRVFDYGTISDVILHLSYTADYDETHRNELKTGANRLLALLTTPNSMTRTFSLRQEFPDVFHRLATSAVKTEVTFTIEPKHFSFFLMGQTLRADKATLQVLSSVSSLADPTHPTHAADTKFLIRKKVDPPGSQPGFRECLAGSTATGVGTVMREFDFGDILQTPTDTSGITPELFGDYVIKLEVAGPLAAATSGNGAAAIDKEKLNDIVIKIGYSLA